ncbi:hypothetical protein ACLOJK_014851 [Asimina triloba]
MKAFSLAWPRWPSGRPPLSTQLCATFEVECAGSRRCCSAGCLWRHMGADGRLAHVMAWTSSAAGAASRSGLGGKRAMLPVIMRVDAAGRRARCRALPSFSPSFVDEEGRSWICNRDVVAILSNGSDHPIGASPMRDLDQLHVAVILGGLDLPYMSSLELTAGSHGCRPLMKAMEHRVWCSGGAP